MLGWMAETNTHVMGKYDMLTNRFTHVEGGVRRVYFAAWDSVACQAIILPGSLMAEMGVSHEDVG